MDEVNAKVIERMGDILDAIKVELDYITSCGHTHSEDHQVSETVSNLVQALETLYFMTKKGD